MHHSASAVFAGLCAALHTIPNLALSPEMNEDRLPQSLYRPTDAVQVHNLKSKSITVNGDKHRHCLPAPIPTRCSPSLHSCLSVTVKLQSAIIRFTQMNKALVFALGRLYTRYVNIWAF